MLWADVLNRVVTPSYDSSVERFCLVAVDSSSNDALNNLLSNDVACNHFGLLELVLVAVQLIIDDHKVIDLHWFVVGTEESRELKLLIKTLLHTGNEV